MTKMKIEQAIGPPAQFTLETSQWAKSLLDHRGISGKYDVVWSDVRVPENNKYVEQARNTWDDGQDVEYEFWNENGERRTLKAIAVTSIPVPDFPSEILRMWFRVRIGIAS